MNNLNNFEIPKEIKAKPKIFGLEVKEIVIILLVVFASLTFLKDMIHKFFVIPYFIVVIIGMVYLFSNSLQNPGKKNYESIFLFFKHNRKNYHPIDGNATSNQELLELVQQENELIIERYHGDKAIEDEKIKVDITLTDTSTSHEEIQEEELLEFEEKNRVVKNVLKKEKNNNENDNSRADFLKEKESAGTNIRKRSERKQSKTKIFSLPTRKKGDYKEIVMDNQKQNQTSMNENVEELQSMKGQKRSGKRPQKDYSKHLLVAISILLFSVGSWYLSKGNSQDVNTIAKEQGETEEVLVNALKKFSMKEYEQSAELFDGVEYETLNDEDKDLMLLSYLFSDQPEKAIELEPSFAESVISYYKARHSMQKLRDLAEIVDSKAIDFEIAVSDKDYWTIIELKESVKMKGERPQNIVNAYLQLDNTDGARKFAEKLEDETLIELIEQEIDEFEKKDKK